MAAVHTASRIAAVVVTALLISLPSPLRADGGDAVPVCEPGTGRLDYVTLPGDVLVDVEHDAETGQVVSMQRGQGSVAESTVTYAWDGALPIGETWSGNVSGSVGVGYDDLFRVASQTVTAGGTTSAIGLTYDPDGVPSAIGAMTLGRHATTGLLETTTVGAVTTQLEVDGYGQLVAETARVSGAEQYVERIAGAGAVPGRDGLGRIRRRVETVAGTPTEWVYEYDAAGRLHTVRRNGTLTGTYTYDGNGNRLTGPDAGTAYTYDQQDRLIGHGATTYGYTENGYLETKTVAGVGTTTYEYDALGNLLTVALPDGATVTYQVDAVGRRVGRTRTALGHPAEQRYWLYQDGLRPVAELNELGQLVSQYVYGTQGNVPDYFVQGGQTYRILTDHLGSPRLVVNVASGLVVERLEHDAWGAETQHVVTADPSNPGYTPIPFGFAGGLVDADTGLVRFGARDYDPATGRWTAKDPIGFGGGDTNLYGYVLSDPVNLVDPSGEIPPIIVAALIGYGGGLLYYRLSTPAEERTWQGYLKSGLWWGATSATGYGLVRVSWKAIAALIALSTSSGPGISSCRKLPLGC